MFTHVTNFLLRTLIATVDYGSSTFNTKFAAGYSELATKGTSGSNKANLALLVGITIYRPANAFQYTTHTWSAIRLSYASQKHPPIIRLTQCCTQFKSPGVKILCVLYLHYTVAFTFKCMEIPETKSCFPRGFELGTTLS